MLSDTCSTQHAAYRGGLLSRFRILLVRGHSVRIKEGSDCCPTCSALSAAEIMICIHALRAMQGCFAALFYKYRLHFIESGNWYSVRLLWSKLHPILLLILRASILPMLKNYVGGIPHKECKLLIKLWKLQLLPDNVFYQHSHIHHIWNNQAIKPILKQHHRLVSRSLTLYRFTNHYLVMMVGCSMQRIFLIRSLSQPVGSPLPFMSSMG